jgi:hypothetical protein
MVKMTKLPTAPLHAVGFAALVLLTASVATAQAEYPVAPDVVVFCEPTLRPFITELGAQLAQGKRHPGSRFCPADLVQLGATYASHA